MKNYNEKFKIVDSAKINKVILIPKPYLYNFHFESKAVIFLLLDRFGRSLQAGDGRRWKVIRTNSQK
jgi:hypothetical protein